MTEDLLDLIAFIDKEAQEAKPIMDDYSAGEYNMLIRLKRKVESIYEKHIKIETESNDKLEYRRESIQA